MKRALLTVAILSSISCIGAAAPAPTPSLSPSATKEHAAIDGVRTIGVALYEWYAKAEHPKPPAAQSPDDAREDISRTPALDRQRAAALHMPAAIVDAIGSLDPWGQPYDIRVGDGSRSPVLVVRSAGADGRFEGDSYAVGSFSPDATDRDLVWADGYFVRWPTRRH